MTELPQGWREVALGEVCVRASKVKPEGFERATFTYVDIGSINNQRNVIEGPQLLAVAEAPSRARQLLEGGDTVFSTVRPYLRNIAWVGNNLAGEVASTGFTVLRAKSGTLSSRLLFFFATSDELLDQVLPLQQGTSYPAVRDSDLFDAKIALPPLAEQERIVEILEEQFSRLDSALASVKVVREKAKAFRRSLLHAAFSGELTGGTEGWREVALSHVVSVSKETGIPSEKPEYPFVGMEHVASQTGEIVEYGNSAAYKSGAVIADDTLVLYGRLRPYLNKVFIPKSKCFASGEFIPLRVGPDLDKRYLLHLLRSANFVTFAVSLNAGDRPRVKWEQMGNFSLALPPLAEQERIVEILEVQFSRLDNALEVASQLEARIASERRSLLHAAFTGELTSQWRKTHV